MTIPNQNPLGYTGLKETNPPNIRHLRRDPTPQDYVGFDIGDFWINISTTVSWQLLSKAGGVSVWAPSAGGVAQVAGLRGNDGIDVLPVAGFVNVLGDVAQGINTENLLGDLNITAFDASNATKGVSQYSAEFNVAAGVVSIAAPISIANGGTNAVAMGTNTGIVKYDGTSLVTSSTALIDSSNRMTNTAQPAFLAYQASDANNATGKGTAYTLGSTVDLTEVFDQGNNFDHTTGTFTAPITGKYMVSYGIRFSNVSGTMIVGDSKLISSKRVYRSSASCVFNTAVAAEYGQQFSALIDMDAGDTFTVNAAISGGAGNTATIAGSAIGDTFISGYLVC